MVDFWEIYFKEKQIKPVSNERRKIYIVENTPKGV